MLNVALGAESGSPSVEGSLFSLLPGPGGLAVVVVVVDDVVVDVVVVVTSFSS